MDSVSDILGNTKVHGDYHTHVSMIQPLGKFQISRSNMENFWEKYCADVEDTDDDDEKERHQLHQGVVGTGGGSGGLRKSGGRKHGVYSMEKGARKLGR